MIKLTKAKAETLRALAILSQGDQKWWQTELVAQQRVGVQRLEQFKKTTETLLRKLREHVPSLVDTRPVGAGQSWRMTPAGAAVAETQLGVKKNAPVLRP